MKIISDRSGLEKAFSRRTPAGAGNDDIEVSVRQWIADVRRRGDAAVREYTEKFDGVRLNSLEVSKAKIRQARESIEPGLLAALETAARRIEEFHRKQKETLVKDSAGSLGWMFRPLKRIGVCIPGFQAPLPSSVLMTAVPARVAGVEEIVLVTPPGKNGEVAPITLAAAGIAGVDRVFSIGGAQAVAALAYGTESVPAVDKIYGPGNIYVTLAKKLVYGDVGIDGLYGPSEVIIIADDTAPAQLISADLLAQAEHGSLAASILITDSPRLAEDVGNEIEHQLKLLSRQNVARESLEGRGYIAVVGDIPAALELANLYAPEHLCLVVADAERYAGMVTNAGCLFIGENSVEVLVDYVAGPSHVLPTGGTARFASPLNILDFFKLVSVVRTGRPDIEQMGPVAVTMARAEGLDAHARAVEKRLRGPAGGGKTGG